MYSLFQLHVCNGISDLFVNEVTYNKKSKAQSRMNDRVLDGGEGNGRGEIKKKPYFFLVVVVVVVLKVFIGNSKDITFEILK